MRVKVEVKATGDDSVQTSETNLDEYLAHECWSDEERAQARSDLAAHGKARLYGFVGVYFDLTVIGGCTVKAPAQNLGRAMSLVEQLVRGWSEGEEYGEAMGAPMGELRPIINRGRVHDVHVLTRHIRALTGLKWPLFVREIEQRTSPRWVYFNSGVGWIEEIRCEAEQRGRSRNLRRRYRS